MRAPDLGHVVVLGGGVAGLLCAHVLSAHAGRVTVVERDHPAAEVGPRPGVPQSRHTHVLLTSGMRALDDLLPGVVGQVLAAGGPRLEVPGDVGVWQGGQWVSRRNSSHPVVTASRPLLEHVLRERVLSGPGRAGAGVELRSSTEVVELTGTPRVVTGVVVRDRGGSPEDTEHLVADLVVDATGRSGRGPQWWAGLGGAPVTEDVLETGRAYATCVFADDGDGPPHDLRGFYLVPEAGQPLGAIVLPAEGDRWMVTLSGPRGQAPPSDVAGFVDFARDLPHDAPHKWLSTVRAVGRPSGYRHTANRRRRWDRALRDTSGLLVVGDALCAFNPVYGQGLSVAAQNAVALRDALRGGTSRTAATRASAMQTATTRTAVTRRLQRAVLRSGDRAWAVATGADSPMPGATGGALRSGPVERLLNRYLARVRDRVPGDPVVCEAFRDVLFLLAPPSSLLTRPRVLRRALLTPVVPTPPDLPTR